MKINYLFLVLFGFIGGSQAQSFELQLKESDILEQRSDSKFHGISAIEFVQEQKEWHLASDRGQYFIFRNIRSLKDFGLAADTVFTLKTPFWIESIRYNSQSKNFVFSVENEFRPTVANSDTTTYVAQSPSLIAPITPLSYLVPPIPIPTYNKGIEAISISPDGSIWIAPEAGWSGQANIDSSTIHFLRLSPIKKGEYTKQLYTYSPDRKVCPFSPTENVGGISEILNLDNDRLLVLEKCFDDGPGGTRKIKAKLWVTTVHGTSLIKTQTPAFDFSTLPFVVDNLEGMCWWPFAAENKRHLVLITDDNANKIQRTQLILLQEK